MSRRKVTVIAPTLHNLALQPITGTARRRVAAYARVSTDSDEQLTSYEAQVDYYTKHIQSNVEWSFVAVYADEGISATSTKKREGFNRMIDDALDGKIDLILTKSVSRFARNTVDTLTTVRKLKEKGVEIYFEKENIYTLDSKGEVFITIMSSLAQEESRSISENVTWGQRKRFADGKVSLPYKQFLGYEKGEDGFPKIVEAQAKVVRYIYRLFLEGSAPSSIAKRLTKEGIPTPSGKTNWQYTTVESILTNEKYKGDALLQKTYCTDFLTKKMAKNTGQVPQYYVENSHPAIIKAEVFDIVQHEMQRRKSLGAYVRGSGILTNRLICGDCGNFFGIKQWHTDSKYARVVWQCRNRYLGDKHCTTAYVTEDEVKSAFVEIFNSLLENKSEVLETYHEMIGELMDTAALDTKRQSVQAECDIALELIQRCIQDNASTPLNQQEYQLRYDELARRFEQAKTALDEIDRAKAENTNKARLMEIFLNRLQEQERLLTEFDDTAWHSTIDTIVVHEGRRLVFRFKDGTEIPYQLA